MTFLIIKAFKLKKQQLLLGIAITAAFATVIKAVPPAAKTVFNTVVAKTERLLPIYCVQTDEPKIAISFDAA